jgi:anti-anti-sigma factor
MSESPAISVELRPDAVVVRLLIPDLDEDHMLALRRELDAAVKQSPSLPFIVDMARIKFIPSLTLGALVPMAGEFRARRQRLILVALQRAVRQVISITRLDRVMEIMDDVDGALRSVGVRA